MNAAAALIRSLDRAALVRLGGRGRTAVAAAAARPRAVDDRAALTVRLTARFRGDLAALLNRLDRAALVAACEERRLPVEGRTGDLRARLWRWGAALEAMGEEHLGRPYQPVPIVLADKLRQQAPVRGSMPVSPGWPRPVPPARAAPEPGDEPDTLEDLLARATSLIGVRLGARGRDKGAFGARLAALLGVPERGLAEADWRGEVELKSVPVVRDRAGRWRVKEDPAIAMLGAQPESKLRRVLWLARVADDDDDATLLSWYYEEWDARVAELVARYLHTRPKGGAGATTRGHYLQKRYFLESGFLASLNG